MNISQPTLMTIPFALFGVLVTQATAQPPERGQGRGNALRAVMQALDANQDQELSASEIENATAALKAIDSNGDGVINKDDASQRPEGRRDRARPDGAEKGSKGDRQKGGAGAVGGQKSGDRKAGERKAGGGDPARDGAGRRGGAGEGRGDRFVKHAMEFDADGDGKLSLDELTKLSQNMRGPQAGGRGEGGPGGRRAGQGQRGGKRGPN